MIDLRSDVCTSPTTAMWEAMRAAPLGWAAGGEDASVNELERRGAAVLGKASAMFVATCSLANVIAVMAQTDPGDRVLVAPDAHMRSREGSWLTHTARVAIGEPARLVCLENTQTARGGAVLDPDETAAIASRAPRAHLDGARLANASVALGVEPAALTATVDTVAFSLNKGLGAPFGALLAGDAETIAAGRLHLRRLGAATIHKAGIMAAAGLVALESIPRLAEDHRRARTLARSIGAPEPATNIVHTHAPVDALAVRGVLALSIGGRTRLVTHRAIGDDDVAAAGEAIRESTTV